MRGRYAALSILALAAGTVGGVYVERSYLNPAVAGDSGGSEILYWVAPMDPSFRRDAPGQSPMGMDLIPVYAGEEPSGDPAEVSLTPGEINAIGVRTALAQMTGISSAIDTVGFVRYDEHLTSHVHTRVEGWVEQLHVRAVGDRVRKGDILFEMFSPLIGSASAEHLRTLELDDRRMVEVSRNKLRSHGMSDEQIAEIEASGVYARNLKVLAPQDGVVIALGAADGMYLQPGTLAVSLADLSAVWLIVDVFERDIARLSADMSAAARFEHLPGRTFEGTIDYIYPELDAKTRTLPVRLRFDNTERLLRPNMFGTVSLTPSETRTALTVPSEAVIRTGAAERVILKTGEGTFRPRVVTTGLRDRLGESARTEIVQGLAPGEEVVASAQFLIDSESALGAGMARMAPTEEAPARGTGTLVALDREARVATIRHAALDSLNWPAITSRFPVRADVPLEQLTEGSEVAFEVVRGSDGLLGLVEFGVYDGIAATGTGMAKGVTSDGQLTLAHDPIPELGWPAMQMDFAVVGLDPTSVPFDEPIAFDLVEDESGMFSIVAVREEGADAAGASADPEADAPPIIVDGTIVAVDAAARKATITHGPMVDIGMPEMTMDFALADGLDPGALPTGIEMTLTFDRSDGLTMVLAEAEPASPPMEVSGTINTVDPAAGLANITHEPMTEIGMPGMTMDFPVGEELDTRALPLRTDVTLLLRRNADFSMTLVGIAAASEATR